jgi:hypothetical protein
MYKTSDYGQHWTKIVTGIPGDDFVRVIREDRERPGLLYAGTEHSIYVSYDDGEHWKSLAYNLPDTQVADIAVEKHDLVIATHGRSFYILDDIDWMRQSTPETMKAAAHLFEPRPAMRNVAEGSIDYMLAKPADKVTIEILDPANKLVTSFVSEPAGKKKTEEEDEERRGPKPPTTNAGINRFTWNLRYPGAYMFPGMVLWGASPKMGPVAVPGTYHVKLTANGVTQTRDLVVEKDPRVKVTDEDLQKQFDLAWKVRNQLSQADTIVSEIRYVRQQVEERLKANPDASLKSEADAMNAKMTTIEETVYQTKNRSDQDPLNFQIRLNNYIGTLDKSVMMGDAAPTAQAYVVEEELTQRLDAQQKAFDAVVAEDLAKLNSGFAKKKQKAVTVALLPA